MYLLNNNILYDIMMYVFFHLSVFPIIKFISHAIQLDHLIYTAIQKNQFNSSTRICLRFDIRKKQVQDETIWKLHALAFFRGHNH